MNSLINNLLKYRSSSVKEEKRLHVPTPSEFEYIENLFGSHSSDSLDGIGVPMGDKFLKIVKLDSENSDTPWNIRRGFYQRAEFEKESTVSFFAGKIGTGPELFDHFISPDINAKERYGVFVFERLDYPLSYYLEGRKEYIYEKIPLSSSRQYILNEEEYRASIDKEIVFTPVKKLREKFEQPDTENMKVLMNSFQKSFVHMLKTLFHHGIYHMDLHANNIFLKEVNGKPKWFIIDYGRVVLWNGYRTEINIKEHIPRWVGSVELFTQTTLLNKSLETLRNDIQDLSREEESSVLVQKYLDILYDFRSYVEELDKSLTRKQQNMVSTPKKRHPTTPETPRNNTLQVERKSPIRSQLNF
tara:strand:- start:5422 stop:6495 length:1074 start_codon:yes stop_codon:yes gene_type:complete